MVSVLIQKWTENNSHVAYYAVCSFWSLNSLEPEQNAFFHIKCNSRNVSQCEWVLHSMPETKWGFFISIRTYIFEYTQPNQEVIFLQILYFARTSMGSLCERLGEEYAAFLNFQWKKRVCYIRSLVFHASHFNEKRQRIGVFRKIDGLNKLYKFVI